MAETNPLKKVRSDFIFLNEIGEGSFSLVYSVEEKKSGLKFASNKQTFLIIIIFKSS